MADHVVSITSYDNKIYRPSRENGYIYHIQCNFSKPNTLGTKEMVQFREVSGLERFCMYSKYREQDLKTRPV